MSRAVTALIVVVFFRVASGCTVLTDAQGSIPTDAQRRECERNGGYWATAAGFCRIGEYPVFRG